MRANLKQLVCSELLRTEGDAVSVASDSDGLAALSEQHHVFTVFTVEVVGDARCYRHGGDIKTSLNTTSNLCFLHFGVKLQMLHLGSEWGSSSR